jgi:hypothetical protein
MHREIDLTKSQIERHWKGLAASCGGRAQRLPIQEILARHSATSSADASRHLSPWLLVFDETLQCCLQFEGFVRVAHEASAIPAALLLARRICAVLGGVRHLVVAGLEEPAAVLGRSALESLDLCIVCIADQDFAARFLALANDFDANAFWKAEVGYGRIRQKLQAIRSALQYDEAQLAELDQLRSALQLEFSESVHSGSRAVLRAAVVPSLKHRGMWSQEFLGHVSRRSPYLLSWLSLEVHKFAENVFSIMHEKLPGAVLANAPVAPETEGFLVSCMTLQALIVTYPNVIPPSEDWWREHQGLDDEDT